MNVVDFIFQNVHRELIKLGYSEAIAAGGGYEAVDYYRRCSQASKKGAMFEDCLYRGKVYAEINTAPNENPKKKKSRSATTQRDLFK